ncbi:MAG: sugar transferase [Chloroflexi bacterium]|nr:sugar transferase [Chloroflexota bacterium]
MSMRWLPESLVRGDGSIRKDWASYAIALLLLDAFAAATALVVAFGLRPAGISGQHYIAAVVAQVPCWLAVLALRGLYARSRLLSGADEYARVVQAAALLAVSLVMADLSVGTDLMARAWLLAFISGATVLSGVQRVAARRVVYAARARGAFRPRAVIVGVDERSLLLARHLSDSGFNMVGFLDDFRPIGSRIGSGVWPVLGAAYDLERAAALGADEVFVNPLATPWESRRAILGGHASRRFDVRVLAGRDESLTGNINVVSRAGVPMYALREVRLTGLEAVVKRGFDVVSATALLVVFGPLAIARITSRCMSRRPVFERHTLLDVRDRAFTVYTLAGSGPRVVSKLPALLAVLRGQMSIVGPAPIESKSGASGALPELRMMKPGLTSAVWANARLFDDASMVAAQLEYVRNYSVWRDIQILWHRLLAFHRSRTDAANPAAFWQFRPYTATAVEQDS